MVSALYNDYETRFSRNNVVNLLNNFAKNGKLLVITGNIPVFYDKSGINPVLSILLKIKKIIYPMRI